MQDIFEHELTDGLSHWSGEDIDIIGQVYDIISRQPDKGKALKFFLENADNFVSVKDRIVEEQFTKEDLKQLKNQYYKFVKQLLYVLLGQDLPVEKFYEQLWLVLGENVLLPSDREKIYALYVIRSDIRIPYFRLEKGVTMEEDEFNEITLRKKKEIKKSLVIVRANYDQRTERSSLLMEILNGCSEREKIVVLAHILSGVEQRVIGGIKPIIQEAVSLNEKEQKNFD